MSPTATQARKPGSSTEQDVIMDQSSRSPGSNTDQERSENERSPESKTSESTSKASGPKSNTGQEGSENETGAQKSNEDKTEPTKGQQREAEVRQPCSSISFLYSCTNRNLFIPTTTQRNLPLKAWIKNTIRVIQMFEVSKLRIMLPSINFCPSYSFISALPTETVSFMMKDLPHTSYAESNTFMDKHTQIASVTIHPSMFPFIQQFSVVECPDSSECLRMQNGAVCVTFGDGILINCESSSESSCINIVSIKEQLF